VALEVPLSAVLSSVGDEVAALESSRTVTALPEPGNRASYAA